MWIDSRQKQEETKICENKMSIVKTRWAIKLNKTLLLNTSWFLQLLTQGHVLLTYWGRLLLVFDNFLSFQSPKHLELITLTKPIQGNLLFFLDTAENVTNINWLYIYHHHFDSEICTVDNRKWKIILYPMSKMLMN